MFIRRMFRVVKYIIRLIVIVLIYSVALLLWSLLFSEKEQYIDSITINVSPINTDSLDFPNGNIEQTISPTEWDFHFENGKGKFINRNLGLDVTLADTSVVTSIIKSDVKYATNDYDYLYIVGNRDGKLDIYMFKEALNETTSIDIGQSIVGIAFLDYKIFVIALNPEYEVYVYWITQKKQDWEIINSFHTEYTVEKILDLHYVSGLGVFVSTTKEVVLFSNNTSDYYAMDFPIEMQSVQGDSALFVVSYFENENLYYQININNYFTLSLKDRDYGTNSGPLEKRVLLDNIQFVDQYITQVDSEERSFEFIVSDMRYLIGLP